MSRYAIFSASDRNQISTWPQSIVFQFSCAIDRADGCASKVIHSPVSGCAYLIGAQFLGGDGAEAAPGLGLGGVQRKSLLLSSGPFVGVTSLVGGPAALCTTESDRGPGRAVADKPESRRELHFYNEYILPRGVRF